LIGDSEQETTVKMSAVRLLVGDFPATFRFWRDVMQFPALFGDEPTEAEPAPTYAYFSAGDVGVELFGRDAFAAAIGEATPVAAPTGRQMALTVKTDDVDVAYADVVARGATAIAGPQDHADWGARTAYIADPEGNLIELYGPLHAAQ